MNRNVHNATQLEIDRSIMNDTRRILSETNEFDPYYSYYRRLLKDAAVRVSRGLITVAEQRASERRRERVSMDFMMCFRGLNSSHYDD